MTWFEIVLGIIAVGVNISVLTYYNGGDDR
jgi:hypothetical protein